MKTERRQLKRNDFSLYMSVLDELTGKPLGTLLDISTAGFKLETKQPIPLNVNIRLRIEHTNEISNKKYIIFTARARWCEPDLMDTSSYNIGFQILDISPGDLDIYVQMCTMYGSKTNGKGNSDYFWN